MTKYADVKHLLLKRYADRMAWAKEYLGGRCVSCGTSNNLEFDHIDPKTKKFSIAKNIGYPLEEVKTELAKCQLLCRTCHQKKTNIDMDYTNKRSYNPNWVCPICNIEYVSNKSRHYRRKHPNEQAPIRV